MPTPDYETLEFENQWCVEQRETVAEYLRFENVAHGRIGDWPAWHLAPYVAVWAIESLARPEWIGWWVISGDLPTDYISAASVEPPQHPRKAMRVFAENWLEVVDAWKQGREVENTVIGDPESHEELGPLLEKRALLLLQIVEDSSNWEE